jgi:uncharacterized membrane protein YbhN (UPF0104 family)
MLRLVRRFHTPRIRAALTSRAGRRILAALSVALAVGVTVVAARRFSDTGWPLAGLVAKLVGIAGGFFLLAYAFKAYGWQRLFKASERPRPLVLAAAGGAACVSGAALPGRLDDVVRVAVVRRCWPSHPGLAAVCLSLVTLGLVDTAALLPFSAAAAVTSDGSLGMRAALGVVSAAGVGAAAVVAFLPRAARSERLSRFRVVGWLGEHAAPRRDAGHAALFVSASWAVRAVGLFFLLTAFGVTISFPLAIAFLCATAASAALPIAPAGGAVTQASAGAAILVASGVPVGEAVAFSVAAHALFIVAGAAVVALAAVAHGAQRVAAYARA